MGCVDSKEKSLDHHPYHHHHHHPHHHPHPHHPHPHHQPRGRGGVQPQQPQHYRQRQPPPPQPEVSQPGRVRQSGGRPGGQEHHGGRRTSAPSGASSSASSLDRHVARERDRERRVVTDPRGTRRSQPEEEAGPGLGRRNQFDRASQLRRSKKRKKSRDNSVLEASQASQASETSKLGSRQNSPAKTSAKDIAIQETVKTLKNSTSQNPLNVSSEPDNRSEYHTKYGNLI